MEGYTSFGSYAPIYTKPRRAIFDELGAIDGRKCFNVLTVYAEHADALGMMFPSVRRVMELSHYSETNVKRCLRWLADLDYMRAHVEYSVARKRPIVTFQINPQVLHIRPDYVSEALILWEKAESLYCNVIVNEQPDTEPVVEPEKKPATKPDKNHHHHQRASFNEKAQTPRLNQPEGQKAVNQDTDSPKKSARSAKNNQHEVQNQSTPPSSAPPPRAKLDYSKALPVPADEDKAQILHSTFNTRLSQVRELVHTHGRERIDTALVWLSHEKDKGAVKNPYGLLKWWLKENYIAPGETPRRESMLGQYADYGHQ